MKLADRTVETHSAGVKGERKFTIAQTAKMFKILSDSLYPDKIMAVIRELSTNAYDAHVDAANKNPFRVTLPTAASPNFIVRDYGTGLSQADMEVLYTTYGASNKNNSNDFVGCLGLGSKSPFAYTKSFTSSSYYNGRKYTYVAAMDEAGEPTLHLLDIAQTKEPNGLEVSFAVKQADFTEFSTKAARVFHYFKQKPIIEGGIVNFNKTYSNTNLVISGDGWRVCSLNNDNSIFPNQYNRINSGIIAIMGNIAYPVDISSVIGQEKTDVVPDHIQKWNRSFGKADIDNWKNFVKEIFNSGLYLELDFGIGELEMDPSREGLQYTKQVIKSLRDKTQDIYLEMKEEFTKKISEAKTLVEAISLYHTMNDISGNWGVGATWIDPNGKNHDISSGTDLIYKIPTGKSLYAINFRSAGYRSRRLVYQTDRIHHETLSGKGAYSYYSSPKKKGKVAFFFSDVKTEETAKKIVVKYCNDNDCFGYLLVDTNDHNNCTVGFDDLIKDVGLENIHKVSDFKNLLQNTNRKKVNRVSNGAVSDQDVFFICGEPKNVKSIVNQYNDACYLGVLSESDIEDFLESDEIIYVPIVRYSAVEGCSSISGINSFKTRKDENGKSVLYDRIIGNKKVYAIKKAFADRLISEGYNMVSFDEFFKNKLKEISKDYEQVLSFNDIYDYCSKQLEEKHQYYNQATGVEKQFAYHMLNIFGLDYAKYIRNKTMVSAIDSIMVMNFFNHINDPGYKITRFSSKDYTEHMNSLLSKFGIDQIDTSKLMADRIELNKLNRIISEIYPKNFEQYTITESKTKAESKLPKMSSINASVKAALDKNPVLKYILASEEVTGRLNELQVGSNAFSSHKTKRYGYHQTSDEKWLYEMTEVELTTFRTQISSLIV